VSKELTEIIGLLKKLVTAPVTMAKNIVYGKEKVRKDKLAQLRAKRHALVGKLHQVKLAQKSQKLKTDKSSNLLKNIDDLAGTNTHNEIFGQTKPKKASSGPKVSRPKKRKIKTENTEMSVNKIVSLMEQVKLHLKSMKVKPSKLPKDQEKAVQKNPKTVSAAKAALAKLRAKGKGGPKISTNGK
jgi:hypothetical protein